MFSQIDDVEAGQKFDVQQRLQCEQECDKRVTSLKSKLLEERTKGKALAKKVRRLTKLLAFSIPSNIKAYAKQTRHTFRILYCRRRQFRRLDTSRQVGRPKADSMIWRVWNCFVKVN